MPPKIKTTIPATIKEPTTHMLISLLESPANYPDWKLACNYMKLIAVSLATKKVFIKENYNVMVDSLIDQIVDMLCA